ncbi:AAA family ATPase [uncultured Chryseobacterium sp.]|uniref:AAA family ATPase n=1 Tax=uncultured Chryseobacterium sp. TaxID=259322 RepID=UPI0025F8DF23|nr:AAA family ATPase [uncultured Chryseobacterium sp.]
MQTARFIVKNFGPLINIDIEVRDFLCLIGKQATGKSTIAKLLAIFEDENFRKNNDDFFEIELDKYGMLEFLTDSTFLFYSYGNYSFIFYNKKKIKVNVREEIKSKILDSSNFEDYKAINFLTDYQFLREIDNESLKIIKTTNIENIEKEFNETVVKKINVDVKDKMSIEILNKFLNYYDSLLHKYGYDIFFDSQYIPSERNFLHIIAENVFGLINNNIQIPKHLLEIGQEYEKALNVVKEIPLNLIDKSFTYKREGKTSYIYHNDNEKVDLIQSASGMQSIIPIILLIEYAKTLKENYHFNYVIEEPELNIYPKTQHQLIKYLIKNVFDFTRVDYQRKKMVITTHSPYILASINNLLLAFQKGKEKPKEVNKIINKSSWINPKNFNAYELRNGKSYKIMNHKLGQLKSNMIDQVSDEFADEFDKILSL